MEKNPITATDIDNAKVEKEKELSLTINDEETVRQEILKLQRKIIDLQGEKKDLEIGLSKAKHVKELLKNDISILKSKYWAAKNSWL